MYAKLSIPERLKRSNRFLLLCNLRCVVFGDIGFGTVFATFRSGHSRRPHFCSKFDLSITLWDDESNISSVEPLSKMLL